MADEGVAETIEPFKIYEGRDKDFSVALRHQNNIIFIREPDAVERYRSTFSALERESVTCAGFQPEPPCETS